MLKLSILIGIVSAITYLASTGSQHIDSFYYVFVLSVAALLLAILAQLSEKSKL
jgi:hypothetical protein